MCGKFTQMSSWREIHDWSAFFSSPPPPPVEIPELVTPMRRGNVLHLDRMGRRAYSPMRWGFPGAEARNASDPPKFIHARAETIDSKPTFAESFRDRRGILPVHTFNEGEEVGSKVVQYTITPKDGMPLGIAVIWREWTFQDGEVLDCFVMATVPPNALIGTITDRMPAVMPESDWGIWLGETDAGLAEIKALLRTVEGDWEMAKQVPNKKGAARPLKPPPEPMLF